MNPKPVRSHLRSTSGWAAIFAVALLGTICAPAQVPVTPTPSTTPWHAFEGTWSATGTKQALDVGGGRTAFTFFFSGNLTLATHGGMSRGFRGVAIGYFDGADLSVGKCVWTDERGDRIFSELRGEAVEKGKRIYGTITGGTGRYAGLSGEYSFLWQYVVVGEDGTMQGRAVDLKGRYQRPAQIPRKGTP